MPYCETLSANERNPDSVGTSKETVRLCAFYLDSVSCLLNLSSYLLISVDCDFSIFILISVENEFQVEASRDQKSD